MEVLPCLHPKKLFVNGAERLVPCGYCDVCLQRKASRWTAKIIEETKHWSHTYFMTITYDDEHLPKWKLSPKVKDGDDVKEWQWIDVSSVGRSPLPYCTYGMLDKPNRELYKVRGYVAGISIEDHQKFLKRLRSNLYYKLLSIYGEKELIPAKETLLRFYVCFEYGPSTIRPHMHYILWTESEYFSSNARELCRASWTYGDWDSPHWSKGKLHTSCEIEPVLTSVAEYVSGYVNSYTSLPRLLQLKEFRPINLYSKNPAIGSPRMSEEEIREFLYTSPVVRISNKVTEDGTTQPVVSGFPSSFVARYFPKIVGYSNLSADAKRYIYTLQAAYISSDVREFTENLCREFNAGFINNPEVDIYMRYLLSYYKKVDDGVIDFTCYDFLKTHSVDELFSLSLFKRFIRPRIQKLWNIIGRVYDTCVHYNIDIDFLLDRIDLYYYKISQQTLSNWYTFLEKVPLDDQQNYYALSFDVDEIKRSDVYRRFSESHYNKMRDKMREKVNNDYQNYLKHSGKSGYEYLLTLKKLMKNA